MNRYRVLGIAALAAASILMLLLRGAVSSSECLVEHVDRVVRCLGQHLRAEAREHRVAPPVIQPRKRLAGRPPADLRKPRQPVRWQH